MSEEYGRPRKAQKKEQILQVRLEDELKALFRDAAQRAGLDVSAWARERLLDASRGELGAWPPARPVESPGPLPSVNAPAGGVVPVAAELAESESVTHDDLPNQVAPYVRCVEKIKQSGRVRVPPRVSSIVPWISHRIANAEIECLGTPGPAGQMVMLPKHSFLWRLRKSSEASLASMPPKGHEFAHPGMHLHRYFAESCHFRISSSPDGFLFLETQERRDFLVRGTEVLFFASQELLELWEPGRWQQYIGSVASELNEQGSLWLDALSKRGAAGTTLERGSPGGTRPS